MQTRKYEQSSPSGRERIRFATIVSTVELRTAPFTNTGILNVAAATFHRGRMVGDEGERKKGASGRFDAEPERPGRGSYFFLPAADLAATAAFLEASALLALDCFCEDFF